MLDIRELAQLPERPEDVCSLIARFAEEWTARPPAPRGERGSEHELAAAEQRLGQRLPTALRWLYAAYGNDNTLIGAQDRLLPPEDLATDGEGVVTVAEENQKCAEWGYRSAAEDTRREDPPVFWKDLQGLTGQGEAWQPYQPRLSVYLLETVFSEAMLAGGAFAAHRELDPAGETDLSAAVPLAIPEHTFWADPSGAPARWYALEDVLIRDDGGTWLWALAKTEQALRRLHDELPGPWERLEG